jgi:aminopeptidase N
MGINSCNEIEQLIIIFVLLYKVSDCFPQSSRLLKLFYIMKKLLLSLAMILSVMLVEGQCIIPELINENYCNHKQAFENQFKYYSTPEISNGLLEKYDVSFYFLDLNVENDTVFLSGNVTIQAKPTVTALDTFAFELISSMTIDSVFVNGIQRYFQHLDDLAKVPLSPQIQQGILFSVKIYYHGTPPIGDDFSGIFTDSSTTYHKNVTWTLSEPYSAKEWWPTKQDLNDKADSVWVFLTTSNENKAGSEGLLTGVKVMPNGKVRYEWKSKYPIDYYLISFAVADYQDYSLYAHPAGTSDSVLIQNYIYDDPICLVVNKLAMDETALTMELFSELFGPYPFINEKYGHCLAELGGGMEHQTMTTIGNLNFEIIAHELGHMWFGDKVTCATWSDIWINEGFASYADYLAHHFLSTPFYDSLWLKLRHDNVKGLPGGSVYVPPEELGDIGRIFDGRLSYSKGALLLHMIRFELQDDDMFFNVLKTFVDVFGNSVATGDNFRDWLEFVSGKDFTDFFNQWYYGEGYPIYDIVWYQGGDNLSVTSTQTTSTNVTPLFKMQVPYHLIFTDGTDTTLLLYQDANLSTFHIPISKTIDSIEIDPEQWILYKLNSISLGIEESDSPLYFTFGPNPARDYIRIFFSHPSDKLYTLSIADLTGRNILTETKANTDRLIELNRFSPGVYIVSLSDGTDVLNKRLIVE